MGIYQSTSAAFTHGKVVTRPYREQLIRSNQIFTASVLLDFYLPRNVKSHPESQGTEMI